MVQDEGGLYLAGSGVYGSVAPLRQLPELDSDWGPDCDSCRAAPDTYSSVTSDRLQTSFLAGLRLSHPRRFGTVHRLRRHLATRHRMVYRFPRLRGGGLGGRRERGDAGGDRGVRLLRGER